MRTGKLLAFQRLSLCSKTSTDVFPLTFLSTPNSIAYLSIVPSPVFYYGDLYRRAMIHSMKRKVAAVHTLKQARAYILQVGICGIFSDAAPGAGWRTRQGNRVPPVRISWPWAGTSATYRSNG